MTSTLLVLSCRKIWTYDLNAIVRQSRTVHHVGRACEYAQSHLSSKVFPYLSLAVIFSISYCTLLEGQTPHNAASAQRSLISGSLYFCATLHISVIALSSKCEPLLYHEVLTVEQPPSEDIDPADMSQQTEYPVDLSVLTSRQHLVIRVTTTILVLAFLSYGLRLYAKRITAAHIWWDDYLIGIGLSFATIPCICNYVGNEILCSMATAPISLL